MKREAGVLSCILIILMLQQVTAGTTENFPQLTSCLGDMNCDGAFDNGDIDAFVLSLVSLEAYNSQYPGCEAISQGDINIDGELTLFDIDPFATLIANHVGQCVSSVCGQSFCPWYEQCNEQQHCEIAKGQTLAMKEPSTHTPFNLYIPSDASIVSNLPVILSFHGTIPMNKTSETGPSANDWGGPTWPQAAENRSLSPGFVVVVPQLNFSGYPPGRSSACVELNDERNVLAIMDYLQTQNLIGSTWWITGLSSGASLAESIGLRHPDKFSQIVARHSSFPDTSVLGYALDEYVQYDAYYNENGDCLWNYSARHNVGYDWRTDERLRGVYVLLINGDADPPGASSEDTYHGQSIDAIRTLRSNPPSGSNFTRILWRNFPSMNDISSQCLNTTNPFYPHGCHAEDRDITTLFFFQNKNPIGDIDIDSDVDCADYALLQRCVNGNFDDEKCDLNTDGIYNENDLAIINTLTTVDADQEWQFMTEPLPHISCNHN